MSDPVRRSPGLAVSTFGSGRIGAGPGTMIGTGLVAAHLPGRAFLAGPGQWYHRRAMPGRIQG